MNLLSWLFDELDCCFQLKECILFFLLLIYWYDTEKQLGIYWLWLVLFVYYCEKGSKFLVWFGPTVRLAVSDPDLIREIFTSKSEFCEKNEPHPLVKQLEGDGLLSLKGQKWALHRKIISPSFHMDNLKVNKNLLSFILLFLSLLHFSQMGFNKKDFFFLWNSFIFKWGLKKSLFFLFLLGFQFFLMGFLFFFS